MTARLVDLGERRAHDTDRLARLLDRLERVLDRIAPPVISAPRDAASCLSAAEVGEHVEFDYGPADAFHDLGDDGLPQWGPADAFVHGGRLV